MKKMFVYLAVIVALFAVLFIVNQQSEKTKNAKYADNVYGVNPAKLNPATKNLLDDPNYQNIILPDQLSKKIKNKESFFAYFFSPTCGFCLETTPKLIPLASELNVTLHQFNLLEFHDGYSQYHIQSTPTLVYFKDGKEADRMVGGITTHPEGNTLEKYKEFLAKYNAS